jgi:hypothetical protein
MTAEICVMNREAIALASDSAVTIGDGTKIYNSANKIFTLSKFHPVGIMISGNASFMNIPWETVIKNFRKKFHDKCLDHLEDYAEEFISFLGNKDSDISLDIQKLYVTQVSASIFNEIRQKLIEAVEVHITDNKSVDVTEINVKLSNIINEIHRSFSVAPDLDALPKDYSATLKKEFDVIIQKTMADIFEKLTLSEDNVKKLQELVYFIFVKQIFPNDENMTSGVVICGFGDKELFPSSIAYNIESSILNNVKYRIKERLKAEANGTAAIAPYAQGEMVHTFIHGIDPKYRAVIETYTNDNLTKLTELIIDNLDILKDKTKPEKDSFKEQLNKKISEDIISNFKNQMDLYSQENHVNPILQSVAVLPKDELASMAETFINLTSFKRRVASDQKETVGGPIDVAVITKGDGFIWIKRKHYFKPELNQHFLRNYNRKIGGDDCDETEN